MKIEAQCEIDVYISDENCLCMAFDKNDLFEDSNGKQVLIINSSNVELFITSVEAEFKEMIGVNHG
jgi:hypothetical protein